MMMKMMKMMKMIMSLLLAAGHQSINQSLHNAP